MFPRRFSAMLAAGFLGTVIVASSLPAVPQEPPPDPAVELEPEPLEATLPQGVNPDAAVSLEDPTIPPEQLRLLVKPLTLEELQNEAAAWLILLKQKAAEISEFEIVIKRENAIAEAKQAAADAVEAAKKDLEAAEAAQKQAEPDSPEAEEAVKKAEEAREALKQANVAIAEALQARQELQEDPLLKAILDRAEKNQELEAAKESLKEAEKKREDLDVESDTYKEATKKIERLTEAIAAVEAVREERMTAEPDSPEYQQAVENLDRTRATLTEAQQAIQPFLGVPAETPESEENLTEEAAELENLEEQADGDTLDTAEMQKQEQQLEDIAEDLEETAEEEADLKNQLVVNVTELQSVQTAIIDRFKVVLDELERKGGDAEPYRKYIEAVSIIEIDVTDTEGLGVRLVGWLTAEEGGLRWAVNLGKFLGILVVTVLVAQLLAIALNRALRSSRNVSDLMRQFLVMLVRRGGILLGIILGLTALEVSLGPLLAVVGGASFILAFALQSNLGNFASGLMLMLYKPFDIGDEVKVGETWGWIESINLANTKIKGWSQEIILIPNNTVWSSTIENFTSQDTRRGSFTIRIDYDTNIRQTREAILEVARSHPLVLESPAPHVIIWDHIEYFIALKFQFSTRTPDFWTAWEELICSIQERFEQEGIPIGMPHQGVFLKGDGNAGASEALPASTAEAPETAGN